MSSSTCSPPPLAVAAQPILTPYGSDAELIRRKNLKHESQIKTFGGSLTVLAGFPFVSILFGAVVAIIGGFGRGTEAASAAFANASVQILIAAVAAAVMTGGIRLYRMKPVSMFSGILLCLASFVFVFPFGFALGIAGLFLVCGKRGREILSPDYSLIMNQTTALRSRGSWIIAGFFGFLSIIYFVFMMMGVARIAAEAASRS